MYVSLKFFIENGKMGYSVASGEKKSKDKLHQGKNDDHKKHENVENEVQLYVLLVLLPVAF